jgi:hypothetical protein
VSLKQGSKTVAATQFCHASGTLLNIFETMYFGATTVIPAPVFDARKTLEAIMQER